MSQGDAAAEVDRGRGAVLRGIGANALARAAVLPVSAVLGLLLTRLVISEYGEATYAQYALLMGIGALIPFADLGLSAAVMNAVAAADDPRRDQHVRAVLVSVLRLLTVSATVLLVVAAVITSVGGWPVLLGEGLRPDTGPSAAALSVLLIALGLVVSFGQRVLAGLGRLHVSILLGGLQTPLVLAATWVLVLVGAGDGSYVAVVGYAAALVVTGLTLAVAARAIAPTVGLAVRDAARLRSVRGARVMDTAGPMLVQMIALPLAMQSDRLVLSHVAGVDELTEYSLAAQMFNPFVGVIAVAGMALWPVFARARSTGVRSDVSPRRMSLVFGLVALALAGTVAAASGLLADLASGGRIALDGGLVAGFVALVVAQGLKYPLGMYMTDARGLRFQAGMILLMLPCNLGLSLVLAERIGAAGPVIGSVVGVAVFQVAANWWYVARDRTFVP